MRFPYLAGVIEAHLLASICNLLVAAISPTRRPLHCCLWDAHYCTIWPWDDHCAVAHEMPTSPGVYTIFTLGELVVQGFVLIFTTFLLVCLFLLFLENAKQYIVFICSALYCIWIIFAFIWIFVCAFWEFLWATIYSKFYSTALYFLALCYSNVNCFSLLLRFTQINCLCLCFLCALLCNLCLVC